MKTVLKVPVLLLLGFSPSFIVAEDIFTSLEARINALEERVDALEKREAKGSRNNKSKGNGRKAAAIKPLGVVSNRNPDKHPEFTKLLKHPGLHWAESLRPEGSKAEQDRFYGSIRLGGSGSAKKNPHTFYDEAEDAAKVIMKEGYKGVGHSHQSIIRFPEVGPKDAKSVTVRWEYKFPHTGWRGGKQFQIADRLGGRHAELNMMGHGTAYGTRKDEHWMRLPTLRVYSTTFIGGWGGEDLLTGGSQNREAPDYCAGMYTCPIQTAFALPSTHKSKRSLMHHLNGQLFGHRPNVWVTYEITFDWRDPDKHKIWMHCTDKDVGRTLVVGINGDGLPLTYQKSRTPISEFWIEFNNSKTVNHFSTHVWVRNLAVIKDYDFE